MKEALGKQVPVETAACAAVACGIKSGKLDSEVLVKQPGKPECHYGIA